MRRLAKPVAKPTPRRVRAHPAPPPEPVEPAVDVRECFAHLLAALDALARSAGSPPAVVQELDALRALLGKES